MLFSFISQTHVYAWAPTNQTQAFVFQPDLSTSHNSQYWKREAPFLLVLPRKGVRSPTVYTGRYSTLPTSLLFHRFVWFHFAINCRRHSNPAPWPSFLLRPLSAQLLIVEATGMTFNSDLTSYSSLTQFSLTFFVKRLQSWEFLWLEIQVALFKY